MSKFIRFFFPLFLVMGALSLNLLSCATSDRVSPKDDFTAEKKVKKQKTPSVIVKSNSVADKDEPKELQADETVVSSDKANDTAESMVIENLDSGREMKRSGENDPNVIPVEINELVKKWLVYFTTKDRDRFQRFLDRKDGYAILIKDLLEKNDVPQDLIFLALIESGFSTEATSHAKAVGIWQFIAATGKRYGLTVNNYVDERRDPIKSTEAAARYLKDLHNVFQSWYLAMAAYNAGEMRILQAIMKGNSRDFWQLARDRILPPETMDYIPKFLAASMIAKHPEKFGFSIPEEDTPPKLVRVRVPSPVMLQSIAEVCDISFQDLKRYNPALIKYMTPPAMAFYEVWIPESAASKVMDRYSLLASRKVKENKLARVVEQGGNFEYHRVKQGESLFSIAKKYGKAVGFLRRLNQLKSNKIYVGMHLKVTPAKKSSNIVASAKSTKVHVVRSGENLEVIAKKFGLSVGEIRRLNRLRTSRITVGQSLKIPSPKKG